MSSRVFTQTNLIKMFKNFDMARLKTLLPIRIYQGVIMEYKDLPTEFVAIVKDFCQK